MTPEISTIIASAIGAVAAIVAALIAKDELWLYIKRAKFDLSGSWQGMSVYLPTDTHDIESECVYKFVADIRQSGSRIKFNETITEFFTINMGKIEKHPSRQIKGKGRVLGERDILMESLIKF